MIIAFVPYLIFSSDYQYSDGGRRLFDAIHSIFHGTGSLWIVITAGENVKHGRAAGASCDSHCGDSLRDLESSADPDAPQRSESSCACGKVSAISIRP